MLAVQRRWLDSARLLVKNIYNVFNMTLQPKIAFILVDYIQGGAVQANAFSKGLLATHCCSDAGTHAIEFKCLDMLNFSSLGQRILIHFSFM